MLLGDTYELSNHDTPYPAWLNETEALKVAIDVDGVKQDGFVVIANDDYSFLVYGQGHYVSNLQ